MFSLCILISFYLHVSIFLVPRILAQNVRPLDEICNLIDPINTDMEGNDCHTDQPNEMHQVIQQSFNFLIVCCYQCMLIFPHIVVIYLYVHPCHPLYTHLGHYQQGSAYTHTGTRPYGSYRQCRWCCKRWFIRGPRVHWWWRQLRNDDTCSHAVTENSHQICCHKGFFYAFNA
jgi:hypothetical protein